MLLPVNFTQLVKTITMMKKIILILILFVSMTTALFAAKATGGVKMVVQPDGTTLMVRLMGDEHCNWVQTLDGVMLKRIDNAYYVAKINADGTTMNTGVLAHNIDSRNEAETRLAKAQNMKVFFEAESKKSMPLSRAGESGYPLSNSCPHSGKVKIPVIMMQFTDKPFVLQETELEEMFNADETRPMAEAASLRGYGSAKKYFNDASNGKFDPEFVLIGPYTAKYNHDYYGHKNTTGYQSLFIEAVNKAIDHNVDFSQFDSNNDDYVDLVYVLYAGTSANNAAYGDERNDIWPCCYSGYNMQASGKTIKIGGVSNELLWEASHPEGNGKNTRSGIGVFCHEMSHGLGLPDLYRLNDNRKDSHGYIDYNNAGPEDWDLMDGGENLEVGLWPVQYAAWEKEAMGWIDVEELTEATTVTAYPLDGDKGKAYKIRNPNNRNEYYVIETFQSNYWNKPLALKETDGRPGLHIMHINGPLYSITPNGVYGRSNLTMLPADGFILAFYSYGETIWYKGQARKITLQMFYDDAKGDLWPGSHNVTSISDFKNYTAADMVNNCSVTNIRPNSDGSVTFDFKGGATAIRVIEAKHEDDAVYTINGIFVGKTISGLKPGIYIVNGKKTVVY